MVLKIIIKQVRPSGYEVKLDSLEITSYPMPEAQAARKIAKYLKDNFRPAPK